jgi:DNA-binding Xre family transcriptional regulator
MLTMKRPVTPSNTKNRKLICKPPRPTLPPCPTINTEAMKRLRLSWGLTMEQSAAAAGMGHRQAWYRIESGQRKSVSLRTLAAISSVLRCKVDDLLKS